MNCGRSKTTSVNSINRWRSCSLTTTMRCNAWPKCRAWASISAQQIIAEVGASAATIWRWKSVVARWLLLAQCFDGRHPRCAQRRKQRRGEHCGEEDDRAEQQRSGIAGGDAVELRPYEPRG